MTTSPFTLDRDSLDALLRAIYQAQRDASRLHPGPVGLTPAQGDLLAFYNLAENLDEVGHLGYFTNFEGGAMGTLAGLVEFVSEHGLLVGPGQMSLTYNLGNRELGDWAPEKGWYAVQITLGDPSTPATNLTITSNDLNIDNLKAERTQGDVPGSVLRILGAVVDAANAQIKNLNEYVAGMLAA